jgi:hypothetical protein
VWTNHSGKRGNEKEYQRFIAEKQRFQKLVSSFIIIQRIVVACNILKKKF